MEYVSAACRHFNIAPIFVTWPWLLLPLPSPLNVMHNLFFPFFYHSMPFSTCSFSRSQCVQFSISVLYKIYFWVGERKSKCDVLANPLKCKLCTNDSTECDIYVDIYVQNSEDIRIRTYKTKLEKIETYIIFFLLFP